MASHLTLEERDRIAQLWHQGADQKQIAEAIGRSPATIIRELRRNGSGQEYYAGQAQQEAGRRRRERPLVRKLDDPEINEFVRAGLAREWSPEQIEGRLKQLDSDGCVSSQTIYTWIKQDKHREHWEARLRRRGKRPRQRKTRPRRAMRPASRIAPRSSSGAFGWATSKAIPCWGLRERVSWRPWWTASHGSRSSSR